MAPEPDPPAWVRRVGIWLHLALAVSGLLAGVSVVVTVALRPTRLCAFPTFDAAGCWGATSVGSAGLAGLLGLAAADQFRRTGPPSPGVFIVADVVGLLVGALFAGRGYGSFQLTGLLLLGTSAAGLSLLADPSVRGKPTAGTSSPGRLAEPITPRRLAIGLHLLVGFAALAGALGLSEPVLTSPAGVCGLLLATLGPHLVSYPCESAAFLLHPLVAGVAGVASAWALLEGRTVGKPTGLLVGVLSIVTGVVLVAQGSPIPVTSGLAVFGAGAGLLGVAFHPAFAATGDDR